MAEFTLIRRSIFTDRAERVWKTLDDVDGVSCGCKAAGPLVPAGPGRAEEADGASSDEEARGRTGCLDAATCPTRAAMMECTPLTCSLGACCANRRIQRIHGSTGVHVDDAGPGKGLGLFASRRFRPGHIIGEYVGEVMPAARRSPAPKSSPAPGGESRRRRGRRVDRPSEGIRERGQVNGERRGETPGRGSLSEETNRTKETGTGTRS